MFLFQNILYTKYFIIWIFFISWFNLEIV